eukprot:SAG22_NODE_3351_length_1763_cov_2.019832_4_plen_82_part_00
MEDVQVCGRALPAERVGAAAAAVTARAYVRAHGELRWSRGAFAVHAGRFVPGEDAGPRGSGTEDRLVDCTEGCFGDLGTFE